ncbi:putative bifunctional diguanylate cyclase/phosphodiesterase [Motilimonas eburnea]|uniref:putative bifunctional diguanylate cyclase/phosphodiesterase n=1 Tax=Motilimonas eburnea TaxID=1737488 RepID=UPI001E637D70|nr:EAL domain-containing protein [Motilimonas eburnea]MCE2572733.1 EAL domain-containing protein [Motilimonas eburnea]
MFTSYRSRLIVVIVLILMAVQLATALSVLNTTHQDRLKQQQQSLDVGINVFLDVLKNRSKALNKSLSVLAADYGFRQAIATGEKETVASVLTNQGERVDADVVVLLSPQGELIQASLPGIDEPELKALNALTASGNNLSSSTMLDIDGVSFQFVLQPVKAPILVAWVGMGFVLDQQVAQEAKAITGVDVSFVHWNPDFGTAIASTLPQSQSAALSLKAELLPRMANQVKEDLLTGYLSFPLSLDDTADDVWAVLHLSNLPWELSYLELRNRLLLVFTLTIGLAMLVAWWLAGNLTQPIMRLVDYAEKIGKGKQPQPILNAPKELQILANEMAEMQQHIATREADLTYQSLHDSLTGLNNRESAKQILREINGDLSGHLVQLDLQHFRHINDMIGFANADALLVRFAQRLAAIQPKADFIARIDGDGFLLWFREGIEREQLCNIIKELEQPYPVRGSSIAVNVRAGVLDLIQHGGNVDETLRRVEIALAKAVQSNKPLATYLAGEDEQYQRELTIISDLPKGLAQGQFHLVFQPKVDIQQNQCRAAEALIRWQHPELGFVPPDEFIRLAEHSGNIEQVSHWVIEQAIAQLATWRAQGVELKVAVNLSAHDLLNMQLPTYIQSLLQMHSVPAAAFAIEVTEGAVMQDPQVVIAVLQVFKNIGVSIAIDDFGTGQSSLAYLKTLPVNEVKIDRCFIQDMLVNDNDSMIVDTTIALSHGLGYSVTAEGVEEREGIDFLRGKGCNLIQGYVFSKPLTAEDFATWQDKFNQAAHQHETVS